jgi:hypothetical protein
MAIDTFRTALPCSPPCDERLLAVIEETFLPAKTLGGWVWTELPLRQQTFRARFFHEDVANHSGEPVVLVDCPWCGGALPPPPDDDWCYEGEDGG